MNFLRLLPVLLAALLMAAHFLRAGLVGLVALCLLLPLLLVVKRPWVARLIQTMLCAAALEWVRTAAILLVERRAVGRPWVKMALILGTVAALTAAAALVFRCRSVKDRYGLGGAQRPGGG